MITGNHGKDVFISVSVLQGEVIPPFEKSHAPIPAEEVGGKQVESTMGGVNLSPLHCDTLFVYPLACLLRELNDTQSNYHITFSKMIEQYKQNSKNLILKLGRKKKNITEFFFFFTSKNET